MCNISVPTMDKQLTQIKYTYTYTYMSIPHNSFKNYNVVTTMIKYRHKFK